MAQISFEDVRQNEGNDYSVGFFSLKGEGSEAIVRILCDSISDLDIMTVHPVTVGQSSFPNREVNCIRSPHDPLEACPFCNAGEKVKQRVYIKMLQYDQNGKPSAVVWNRPASQYVPKLKSYIDNYGPLSQIMCKIVRHGSGLETAYDIIPNLNPQQYTLQNYPLDLSDFEGFNVLGSMVMDKNADEIKAFIQTGEFPKRDNNQQNTQSDFVPEEIQGGYGQVPPEMMGISGMGIQNMGIPQMNQPMDQAALNAFAPHAYNDQGMPMPNNGNGMPSMDNGMGRPTRY